MHAPNQVSNRFLSFINNFSTLHMDTTAITFYPLPLLIITSEHWDSH